MNHVRVQNVLAKRRGLTLVEVLIALVLTSMVVVGSWRFFASASDSMSVFMGMSIVDERLALAADLLASDIRRAGMYGTPQSDMDPAVCPKPATALRAVEVVNGTASAGGNNPYVGPDTCTFLAPVLSELIEPVSITGATITFALADPNLPGKEDEFEELFTGHTLRITSPPPNDFSQFVDVTGVNFDARTVAVTPTPTRIVDNGVCGIEEVGSARHSISVLTRVRWEIIPSPDDATDTVLVREELAPNGGLVNGTRIAVAENIVDLQCWGEQDAGSGFTGSDFAPDPHVGDDQGTADLSTGSTTVQRLRIMHFTLAGRTDREFNTHSHQAKAGPYDLLSTWDVDGDPSTAALTLTVGRQVEVSSLVVRRLE